MADERTRDEINRLYWGSDASVGDIADRIGVSRRALYDHIEPRPAGAPCPDCGAPLGFRNRTTAESGEAECAECGMEQDLAPDEPTPAEPAAAEPDAGELEQEAGAARLSPLPTRRLPTGTSAPVVGGTLLVGMALGAAVGWLLRRS